MKMKATAKSGSPPGIVSVRALARPYGDPRVKSAGVLFLPYDPFFAIMIGMKRLFDRLTTRGLMFRQDRELFGMARELAKALPGRSYIVGGFVRDAHLGIRSKDIDVEVFGVDAKTLEKTLRSLYGKKVNAVGASFQTWKVHLDDARDMDVSLPRKESKTGRGHKDFRVIGDPDLDIRDATMRRDFTVNAMLYDPVRGELLDPFLGLQDLKNGILRAVSEKTFVEDPLRVYRALQFAARFDLSVDHATLALLKKMVRSGELESLSAERVSDEFKKLLLKARKPSVGFELMRDIGLVARSYPELLDLIDTPQEPDWHPEGDVWIHTMLVADAAAHIIETRRDEFTEQEALAVMLGSLCHDFGKPATTKLGEKDGVPRIRSLGHSEAGLEPTKRFLANFRFGEFVETGTLACVLEHLKPGQFYFARTRGELDQERYDNAVRKLLKKHSRISWHVILAAAEADFRGRDLPEATGPYEAGEMFHESVLRQELDSEPIRPLLSGKDLLVFGVKPGPSMGALLREVEDERDRGKIKTKEEAMDFVKRRLG